jgi:polyhydroxyalkanoate synthesis regulator protein
MFEQAMLMFSPFGHNKSAGAGAKPDEDAKKTEAPRSQQSEEIAELKAQLASIQSKLEKLSEGSNK